MLTGKTHGILVVDDEIDICWAIKNLVIEKGLPVEAVESGGQALEWMRENDPLMIFLDAKLPDMEGLDLARRIRSLNGVVSIVMVSGYFYRDDPLIQDAMSKGWISDFLSKPFQHDEIRLMLGAACA